MLAVYIDFFGVSFTCFFPFPLVIQLVRFLLLFIHFLNLRLSPGMICISLPCLFLLSFPFPPPTLLGESVNPQPRSSPNADLRHLLPSQSCIFCHISAKPGYIAACKHFYSNAILSIRVKEKIIYIKNDVEGKRNNRNNTRNRLKK